MHTYDARRPRHDSDGIAPPPSQPAFGPRATSRSPAAEADDFADRAAVETNQRPETPDTA